MTLIDNISFRFRMTDELFARELYADWDGFCQRCVTDVLEEFFYRYDKKDIYTVSYTHLTLPTNSRV